MGKYAYEWKVSRFDVDAQTVGEELERIEEKYGYLKPSILVEEGKSTESVLHPLFEWDDSIAAENYRIMQGKNIIACICIKTKTNTSEEPILIRAYQNVNPITKVGEYINTEKALKSKECLNVILANAWYELKNFKKKYAHLKELKKIMMAIDLTLAGNGYEGDKKNTEDSSGSSID